MAAQSGGRGIGQLQQQGQQAWDHFVNLLFPPQCGGCGAPGSLWCPACQAAVQRVEPPWCDKCGDPFVTGVCAICRARPLQIGQIRSVAIFTGALRHGIHRFKYERLASLKIPFSALLADYWRVHSLTADWLVPVPLHPARERERGYNQSELLTRGLSVQIGVPLLTTALRRTRRTAIQMQLNAAERQQNVAGAFDCQDPRVRGKRLVVIDDVCTTGATLNACAVSLLKAGAVSVMGLTLARTP